MLRCYLENAHHFNLIECFVFFVAKSPYSVFIISPYPNLHTCFPRKRCQWLDLSMSSFFRVSVILISHPRVSIWYACSHRWASHSSYQFRIVLTAAILLIWSTGSGPTLVLKIPFLQAHLLSISPLSTFWTYTNLDLVWNDEIAF